LEVEEKSGRTSRAQILRYFPFGLDTGWRKYLTASDGAIYMTDRIENQSCLQMTAETGDSAGSGGHRGEAGVLQ